MKQEPFFTDIEVCKFTQTEKLQRIFEILVTNLQATETSSKKDYTWEYNNKKRYWAIIFNSCNFDNANNINIPFKDIDLQITKDFISISGNNYKISFPPDQLLTIQNRFKRIKELTNLKTTKKLLL